MKTVKNFNHVIPLKSYEQIIAMSYDDAYAELNLYPEEYYNQFVSSNNIYHIQSDYLGIGDGARNWNSGWYEMLPSSGAYKLLQYNNGAWVKRQQEGGGGPK